MSENLLFKVLNLKKDSHAKLFYQTVKQGLNNRNYPLVLQIFKYFKDYLKTECSLYPINFFAECNQFMNNYPYREMKLAKFIRRVNHKQDKYPVLCGEREKSMIDDDEEEKTDEIWKTMMSSTEPISVTVKGVQDVYVPNAYALLY